MTLGNMRANGVRSLDVSCWLCHHRAILSAEPWPDHVSVPTFGPRTRRSRPRIDRRRTDCPWRDALAGGAGLMAADLAGAPRTSLHTQLCGDAHLSNFGAFEAPDRRLVFSINDFDETLAGPFEWDLKRLVASFAVAGRDRGFDAKQREAVNLTVTRSYR